MMISDDFILASVPLHVEKIFMIVIFEKNWFKYLHFEYIFFLAYVFSKFDRSF